MLSFRVDCSLFGNSESKSVAWYVVVSSGMECSVDRRCDLSVKLLSVYAVLRDVSVMFSNNHENIVRACCPFF